MEHHSLSELNKYIKQVIALNFSEQIWIHAEISQIKESKGNIYLDLIEQDKSSDKILAKMQAMFMYRNVIFIKKKLGKITDEVLQNGNEILIRIRVDYSEVYGLKLIIEDLDASYTFGKVELKRQEIIHQIEKEGFKDKNAQIPLKTVLQRIAVISSPNAAGYQDFIKQLEQNSFGYKFICNLYPSSVQGEKVESELLNQMASIQIEKDRFDAIVIIRGGGSKFDLSAFDSYKIARSVSNASLPVLSGIGHDIDISVLDMVSHTALKTPTAVADFLIEHNASFESQLIQLGERLRRSLVQFSRMEELKLGQLEQQLSGSGYRFLREEQTQLIKISEQFRFLVAQEFIHARSNLEMLDKIINASNPDLILKKGYAIVSKRNEIIKDISALKKGDIIDTQMDSGHFKSSVI